MKLHHFRIKTVCVALLMTVLASCGGEKEKLPTAAGDGSSSAATATTPATVASKTAQALELFWKRYGAPESFTPMYVEVLTKLLEAEDYVIAKDYKAARVIVEALIAKYPLMENNQTGGDVWWTNFHAGHDKKTRPHLGEPGAYAHLRMLDDITKVGVKKSLPGTTPIQMAIVMPACSDTVDKTGQALINNLLSPEIEANSYEVVRQSLRLFQSYILAISGGELRLELQFYKVDSCFQIKKETNFVEGNYTAPMSQLPAGVIEKTDMFWLIYPSDFDAKFDFGISSGMGGYSEKPVFISEDDWVIKKRAGDQGGGARTEVERRMYLPEWVQHEIFHHLFGSWPELGLEKTGHQWFDKNNWPADFTGSIEEDYYAEALNKRLYAATPSIAQKLKRANPAK